MGKIVPFKIVYQIIPGVVLSGLAVVFIGQNVAVTELRFLFWTLSMSRALLMFLIFAIGIILGWLLHSYFKSTKIVNMQNKSL